MLLLRKTPCFDLIFMHVKFKARCFQKSIFRVLEANGRYAIRLITVVRVDIEQLITAFSSVLGISDQCFCLVKTRRFHWDLLETRAILALFNDSFEIY